MGYVLHYYSPLALLALLVPLLQHDFLDLQALCRLMRMRFLVLTYTG